MLLFDRVDTRESRAGRPERERFLEGDVETPQYAGSDTVLGGRVTTSQYFRVGSERMRSDRFSLGLFGPEEKRWWSFPDP